MKNIWELLQWLSYKQIFGTNNANFEKITYNSSKVAANDLFVAIRGTQVDGHIFIPDAIEKGARVILCEEIPEMITPEITFIQVENSRKALAEISNYFYDFPCKNLKFIGITGTNGKTTTAFLIQSLLKKIGKRVAVIGTTGIFIDETKIPATHTTPESLELFGLFREIADQGIEWVVMEVSSHSLVQNRVWGIEFDAAIFTNLTHDHLDFHITLENYADAKKILFDGLKKEAVAIVNADDDFATHLLENCPAEKKIYVTRNIKFPNSSENSSKVLRIINEQITFSGNKFTLLVNENVGEREIEINSKLIGKFNIDNLTYSISAILGLQLSLPDMTADTDFLKGAAGRMETITLANEAIGIVDYAHTPDALEKALKTLLEIRKNTSEFEKVSKIICVFGCGGNRDKAKRPLMGKIAVNFADFVVITSDNPRTENPMDIITEIMQGIEAEIMTKVTVIENRHEAIIKAYKLSGQGDIILLAGKGHEDYQIIGKDKLYFDDREELKKL